MHINDEDGDKLGIVTFDNVLALDVLHHVVDGGVGKITSCFGCNSDGQEVDEEDRSPLPV